MYFYNARTRESAWSRPDNSKIITQQEVEAMAAAQATNTPTSQNTSGVTTAAQAAMAQGKTG